MVPAFLFLFLCLFPFLYSCCACSYSLNVCSFCLRDDIQAFEAPTMVLLSVDALEYMAPRDGVCASRESGSGKFRSYCAFCFLYVWENANVHRMNDVNRDYEAGTFL